MYPLIAKNLADLTGMPERLFARKQAFWDLCKDIFLEWYLGDELFEKFYNKPSAQKARKDLYF